MSVSDMCVDVILTGNVRPQFHQVEQIIGDCSIELGGSANIFVSQLAKLGARAGVLGWHGQDAFGNFAREQLEANGVDTKWVRAHPSLKTGIGFALSEPDDRSILTYMGTIDATQPEHLEEGLLASCRHWHIAAYFLLTSLRSSWLPWLKKCRDLGITTSLDPNWDPHNRWEGITELLPFVDVFLPNEQEALAITTAPDVSSAAKALATSGALVVVKRGEKGVLAVQGEHLWEFDAGSSDVRPECVVDATGAGDNFDAGFIRAWLAGKDVQACIELGHRCAVSSLAAPGGVRGQLREA
jgi:sugar/nucleoside kinase (ribokinase family)